MDVKRKKPFVAVIVLIVLISGYFIWERFFTEDNLTVEASGTIEATNVELTAKVPGTIQSITVKAGDKIKQGDLVAEISRSDLAAQRERDALNVAIAQNKLDDLLSGARTQKVKEAQANVNIRQASYDKSQKDLERAEALFEEGSLALTELEGYQNNNTINFNQLEAAKASLSLLLAGSTDSQVQAAQNQVKMMEAVLKATDAVLEDLIITSPIDGTIEIKNYEIGEYVVSGAPLATVTNLDKVWINVYIPTDDMPYVQIGEDAVFTVSGSDRIFEGTITEIATRGEFTPKTIQTKKERTNIVYKVKVEAENSEGILKPGMPGDVIIPKKINSTSVDDIR
ncbi:MAG: secretion protein HlyD [Gracilibacter sp. BRH_c7a]|nr:MAG: secretion protein HlyD [Gracilibacter sp. BRH_c7a]